MISHKHKVIFIHIAKCAGSSIEKAFSIDIADMSGNNHSNLFGWDDKNKLFLQHATPQQLLDNQIITKEIWNNYYKFIIIRNSWDKTASDYFWMMKELKVTDSFQNYLNRTGNFEKFLTDNENSGYRGDHLIPQLDYFYLDGNYINYNRVLKFENLDTEFEWIIKDLKLQKEFFQKKENVNNKKSHYSKYYSNKMIKRVQHKYHNDIKHFGFGFDDKRTFFDKIRLNINGI